ncbi:MAG: hypothetical protein LWX11_11815, partial [Firmicutes bacterium]|nr:hypothetical protein [Bacillota bacterium]
MPAGITLSIPPRGYPAKQILNPDGSLARTEYLHGVFVLTWKGKGTVKLLTSEQNGQGYTTLVEHPNRIVMVISDPVKEPMVEVRASDASDPVRNLRLWAPATNGAGLNLTSSSDLAPGHIAGSLEPAPGAPEPLWHPQFLAHLRETPDYGSLRFMGWLRINGLDDATPLQWTDRASPSQGMGTLSVVDAQYTRYPVQALNWKLGLPYEWMIDLCNTVGKDLWIQVPHTASPSLVRGLAKLVAGKGGAPGLKTPLRVWFECSNEIWNGFGGYLPQYNAARDLAAKHFNKTADKVSFEEHGWGSGQMQGAALKAFEDQWIADGQIDARLINVVAGFAAGSTYNKAALDSVKSLGLKLPEVLAITNYFGYGTQSDVFSLHSFGNAPGVWPAELYDKTRLIVERNLLDTQKSWVSNRAVAQGAGVPLVAYEGGQHMLALGYGDWNNPQHADYMRFLQSFQRSPQMESLYRQHYALWAASGAQAPSLFVDLGTWGFFGYWGAKELITDTVDTSHKWKAFVDWGKIQRGVRGMDDPLGSRPVLDRPEMQGEALLPFSQDLRATGGDGTGQMMILGGSLPPGLAFTSTGSG